MRQRRAFGKILSEAMRYIDNLRFMGYNICEVTGAEMDRVIELKPSTRCCDFNLEPQLSLAEAGEISNALELLANPVRLQILDILAHSESPVCVCELEAVLPVKQPTVSHHLKLLREAGLIECQRRGLWVYYFLRREVLKDLHARMTQLMESFGV